MCRRRSGTSRSRTKPRRVRVTSKSTTTGRSRTKPITVAAAAPGVFTDANSNISNGLPAVAAGQETVLYLTGAGAVSPSIATGAAPLPGTALNALPSPTQTNDDHSGRQARDSSPRVQRHYSGSGWRGAGQLYDSCRSPGGQAAGGGNRRRSAERNRLPDSRRQLALSSSS